MSRVAVVILNYNGQEHLAAFLPSVLAHSPEARIVVADNGSTDDSLALLEAQFPQVERIALPKNGGFSQGYNLALAQLQGQCEYYVLLNSDVEVTAGWLAPLVSLLDENPNIAACQPKIRSVVKREKFEYAGAAGGFIDRWGYPFCRGRLFTTTEEDTGQYDDTRPVFWASGACLLVRAKTYHAVGGLDDSFFAHMEEIDLCWRLQNAGYGVYYCGESAVFHLGGGTLPKNHPKKTFLNFRNGLVLLYKNLPLRQLWYVIPVRLVLDGFAGIHFLLTETFYDFTAVIGAHLNFYWYLPRWHRARKNSRKLAQAETPRWPGTIVWRYFAKRQKKYADL